VKINLSRVCRGFLNRRFGARRSQQYFVSKNAVSLHGTVTAEHVEHHEVPRSAGLRGRTQSLGGVRACVRACVRGVRRWAAGSLPGLCRTLGRVFVQCT